MQKIIAIGGGENGRILPNGSKKEYETFLIDKEIVSLTNKKNPHFLFIVHAQPDSLKNQENYFQTMKKIYSEKFNCICQDLKTSDLKDDKQVKRKIEWADIIYEGGGDTDKMIKLWKNTGFDKILYKAWKDGKVISGISAGAVCWFKSCNSDSANQQNTQFCSISCLDWLNVYVTPHCNEPGRYESSIQELKKNGLVGIMLSNCSAIEIVDDKYRVITSPSKKVKEPYAIKAYWIDNNYYEEKIIINEKYQSLNDLLSKNSKKKEA